jgi:Helix-turn-helix domain
VSNRHLNAVRRLPPGLPAPTKFVLFLLADHACETCGYAWPGVKCLMQESGLKETTVRGALDRLRDAGLINVHGYSTGGRGRATEYVVLPALPELSTAPCGECRGKLKRLRVAKGIDDSGSSNPSRGDGYSPKPFAEQAQNPSRGEPQSSRESESSRAARDAVASPPVSNHPITPAENAAMAREMVKRLSERRTP